MNTLQIKVNKERLYTELLNSAHVSEETKELIKLEGIERGILEKKQ